MLWNHLLPIFHSMLVLPSAGSDTGYHARWTPDQTESPLAPLAEVATDFGDIYHPTPLDDGGP
eukprot:CAMPEP_0115316418 /NCGR_PEP_ID=MMETSP0270-20121206/78115_1 /TAXON_ID=71861 /ORGANISM="Scrippsiella trochoidea, Strain CCMP3099" /LENGTH=62 /DNA_ID=CAMNT_0002735829 /DNA_START=398 /DNA_END=583 /DNA_ORIENTATION=+